MSLKKSISADNKKCTVTFNINANAAAGAEKAFLVGEFNNWDETATPMKKNADGSFSVKKQLEVNKEYQFRYLLDGKTWINDWKADKYIRSELVNDDNSVVSTALETKEKAPAKKAAAKSSSAKSTATKSTAKTATKSTASAKTTTKAAPKKASTKAK